MSHDLRRFVDQLAALGQQPRPAPAAPAQNTQTLAIALLDQQMRAQAGPTILAHTTRVAGQYTQAVQLCRQGPLAAALAQLHHADGLLAALPAEAAEFVTLYQLSAWSYYHYKNHAGAQGVALLQEGLWRSAELERRGYPGLIYRRMEQLQNIAAIYTQQQQFAQAHALLKNTLTFIYTGRAQGLLIDDWDAGHLQRERFLREFVLDAGFVNLATQNGATISHATYGDAHYHRFFFQDLLAELPTDTYNRVVLYNWMYVKAAYHEQGPAAFFTHALAFVADPEVAPQYDVFKANLLTQAAWHGRAEPAACAALDAFAQAHLRDHRGRPLRVAA